MNSKELIVRRLDGDSFDQFFDLLKKHVILSRGDAPKLTEIARESMRTELLSKTPDFEVHVAAFKEEIIGFVILKKEYSLFSAKNLLFLMHLFVGEPYRNKGFGKKLFDFSKQRARELSCDSMEWLVLDWNKQAMEFYLRNGARTEINCAFFELDGL